MGKTEFTPVRHYFSHLGFNHNISLLIFNHNPFTAFFRLVVGTCGSTPHAWVTVYYYGDDGKLKSLSLDPTYHCKATAKAGYKAERYY